MDEELFPLLDGTPANGPGGYTSQSIRNAWRKRVQQKLPWGQNGRPCRYYRSHRTHARLSGPLCDSAPRVGDSFSNNARLTQIDDVVLSMTVAYGAVLSLLVQGHELDKNLSSSLSDYAHG